MFRASVVEAVMAELSAFLGAALARDPNRRDGWVPASWRGPGDVMVEVVPSLPSHPDDGVAWTVSVRGNVPAETRFFTSASGAIVPEEVVGHAVALVDAVMAGVEGGLSWLLRRGVDPRALVDELEVRDVMSS